MEPPRGLWASLWNFIRFLPFFIGLLILGFIKGIVMFPLIFLIIITGASCIILGLWPVHCFYTYYCVLSTKQFGLALKLILCICIPTVLISWPPIGIACSVLGGAAYGLLAPMFATFQAVEEGKTNKFYHCICDGIWSSVESSFTIIRDFLDVCFYSYFSIMYDLRRQGPQRENTMRLGEVFWFGLCYIVASLSIYDEYSNDILDMPEGSCFPRPRYRNKTPSRTTSLSGSFSRPSSFKNPPSRTGSMNAPMLELKPFELADALFKECQHHGEFMALDGIITLKDIEDAKINKDSGGVITIGLPAYCLLQALLRSAKANSSGILLSDNVTEITSSNRPKDTFFDWFLNPLLIIKDQIKADNLSETEEEYLGKLVLLSGDPSRLKDTNLGPVPESELRQAELNALARRLRGITKSISRYPTFRRRFDSSIKNILEELAKKNGKSGGVGPRTVPRSRSVLDRFFSQKAIEGKTNETGPDQEALTAMERDVEIG